MIAIIHHKDQPHYFRSLNLDISQGAFIETETAQAEDLLGSFFSLFLGKSLAFLG